KVIRTKSKCLRLLQLVFLAQRPGTTKWLELRFQYDYLGRRVRKTVANLSSLVEPLGRQVFSDTAFAYWDWHLLAEIGDLEDSPMIQRHYAWGLDKEGVRPGAGGVGGL